MHFVKYRLRTFTNFERFIPDISRGLLTDFDEVSSSGYLGTFCYSRPMDLEKHNGELELASFVSVDPHSLHKANDISSLNLLLFIYI